MQIFLGRNQVDILDYNFVVANPSVKWPEHAWINKSSGSLLLQVSCTQKFKVIFVTFKIVLEIND